MDKPDKNNKKIEEVIKMCQTAISKQTDKNKKGGFGIDDYTDGRIIGGASLARNILKLLSSLEQH
jgi:hypothetical protein